MNRKYPDHPDGIENSVAYKKVEEHGSHVIVASEPSTYKKNEWNLIEKSHCVLVDKDGDVDVTTVFCPKEWNATATTSGF